MGDDHPQLLGDAVSQIVAESRLSMTAFSRQADVSKKQLERIMAGEIPKPHDYTLRKIATAGGRDAEALIAVRDRGVPLPAITDQSGDLQARVIDLEQQVAWMSDLLVEIRDLMQPPADDERDPKAP